MRFDGELPKEKANIIAYGEIKTSEDGGHIFEAERVDLK